MFKTSKIAAAICAAFLVAGLPAAHAADGTSVTSGSPAVVTDRLTKEFTEFAGSDANAEALVTGLRNGTEVTLDGTTFTPPTGKMGFGNVNIALSLARAEFTKLNIITLRLSKLRPLC
ncbi:MAG TPA: hypothetical protein VHE58_08185 [Burkholderiales bacterium]|nr:hypothetical protein [Burkholderiales bacterium]